MLQIELIIPSVQVHLARARPVVGDSFLSSHWIRSAKCTIESSNTMLLKTLAAHINQGIFHQTSGEANYHSVHIPECHVLLVRLVAVQMLHILAINPRFRWGSVLTLVRPHVIQEEHESHDSSGCLCCEYSNLRRDEFGRVLGLECLRANDVSDAETS